MTGTEEVRDKLLNLVNNKKVDYKEIAYHLHMTTPSVYYLLNNAKRIDISIFNQLEQLLKTKGYSATAEGECMQLSKLTFEFNSLTAHAIEILNVQVKTAIEDNKIEEYEANQIGVALENFEVSMIEEISKIKNMLGTR